jgi:1,4-alpha-glucan branching enzyme
MAFLVSGNGLLVTYFRENALASGNSKPKKNAERKVAFEFFAPQAEKVEIAGTFNGWNPAKTPLKKDREGKWKTSILLPPGRHEYRYRVDGNWQNEQKPGECVPNPFGTWNCVLEVR